MLLHLKYCLVIVVLFVCYQINAQKKFVSKVWVADNGNGTYTNPIVHADYSDPDVIGLGQDYYMVASSFDAVPGLPILHSKDLVNWQLINYALPKQIPIKHYSKTQHGNGVWAPAIRYHQNKFYIFYPDPDYGIYVTTTSNIYGKWSIPKLVEKGKGLIDPCPLWDDDGRVYLIHAFAGSRAGIKNMLVIKRLNNNADTVMDDGVLIYDAHGIENTVEGPKLYKRNNYYYVFAPAGGVTNGYQIVLRSKSIYGPYERKVVMQQGNTTINGPHQGAWIHTSFNEDWFIHFQDKNAYGRVLLLEPMKWENDWPVIGTDEDGDGIGNPVSQYKKPKTKFKTKIETPFDDDEFNSNKLELQWQWQANPQKNWAFCYNGNLRMYSYKFEEENNLWNNPAVLLQKFPAEKFTTTIKCNIHFNNETEKFGLVVMGVDYADVCVKKVGDSLLLQYETYTSADKINRVQIKNITHLHSSQLFIQLKVFPGAKCSFSYSEDGANFTQINELFIAKQGKWIGAKMGFFCNRDINTNDAGYTDVDWIRFSKN